MARCSTFATDEGTSIRMLPVFAVNQPQRMEAKNQKLCPILPEDIDVQWLRRLAREGRLYYDACEVSEEVILEDQLQQVLSYVEAIAPCASRAYEHYINIIWRCIAEDEELNDQLFIKKGRHQGLLNRYRIMAIVTVLLEMGVYDREEFSLIALHYRLENVRKKTSIYTSRLNYAMKRQEISRLKRVVKEIAEK